MDRGSPERDETGHTGSNGKNGCPIRPSEMTGASRFWNLRPPTDRKLLADWGEGVGWEQVSCPVDPGHQRGGKRLGKLTVTTRRDPQDLLWTWLSECLVPDSVLSLFREEKVTGFEAREAAVIGADGRSPRGQRWWEIVTTGWGGVAPSESGIHLDESRSCAICGYLRYTPCTDARHVIDPKAWDGSDLFMVWPLPVFKFISSRLCEILRREELTGVRLTPSEDVCAISDGYSPGRLRYYLSADRRARLQGVSEIL